MTPVNRFMSALMPSPSASARTEASLWNHLDKCGIDFRASQASLIERYGAAPSIWSEQLDICILADAKPFIPGLAHPPAFQFTPDTDLQFPPRDLFCAVQASPDHRINYAKAIAALVRQFGEGTVGTAANTASREWRFGHASLSCTVWPPHSQTPGRNTRHELFPETITEAAIWMTPAHRAPLEPEQRNHCQTASPLSVPSVPPSKLLTVGPLTYDWPADLKPLEPGLYLAQDDAALLKQNEPGLIDILPRDWMREIALNRITGGRGGREAIVTLRYGPPARPDVSANAMILCDQYGDPNALDSFAEQLAQRLGLAVDIYEGPMD